MLLKPTLRVKCSTVKIHILKKTYLTQAFFFVKSKS